MSDTTTTDIATQFAYPARTIVRTIVQALVGGLVSYAARQGLDIAQVAPYLTDLATGFVWVGVTALVAWIMTRPVVARLLAGTVLAPHPAIPQHALVEPAAADGTTTQV